MSQYNQMYVSTQADIHVFLLQGEVFVFVLFLFLKSNVLVVENFTHTSTFFLLFPSTSLKIYVAPFLWCRKTIQPFKTF